MKLSTKKTIQGWSLAAPALIGVFLFYIYPFFHTFLYSVTDAVNNSNYVGFKNYAELFESSAFRLALFNTARFYIAALPLILIVPFLAASWVRKHSRNSHLLKQSIFFSILLPSASLMLFVDFICGKSGFISNWMGDEIDIYNSPWAFALLILLYLYKYGGFNFFIYTVALQRIDKSYYEEAYINGASRFQCFRHVTLPFLLPYAAIVLALSVMNSYKIYREAYLIGGYYPHESIYLFQHYINNNFTHMNYSRLCCVSIVILVSAFAAALLIFGIHKLTERILYDKRHR